MSVQLISCVDVIVTTKTLVVTACTCFSQQMFTSNLEKFKQPTGADDSTEVQSNERMIITDQSLADNRERTNRNLRTRELIREKSAEAALVVV